MKNTASLLSVILLVVFFFSSCNSAKNLVIEKRHYGKGYYVHANGKRDVKATTKIEEVAAINDNKKNTVPVEEVIVSKISEVPPAIVSTTPVSATTEKSVANTHTTTVKNVVAEPVRAIEKNSPVKLPKAVTKKKNSPAPADDTDMILIIILCFLLPPLAVYLSQGINTNFWIDVILTLLFFLPGIIFALIVCL